MSWKRMSQSGLAPVSSSRACIQVVTSPSLPDRNTCVNRRKYATRPCASASGTSNSVLFPDGPDAPVACITPKAAQAKQGHTRLHNVMGTH